MIGAPDIEVDLNGHTVSSGVVVDPGEEDGLLAGIRNAGHDNVVIKNGTVQGFGYGVRILAGAIHNVVEGMTLDANLIAGVELFDADDGRNGNTVRDNLFTANGEGGVALVSGSENSVVTGNTFTGNGGVAIRLQNAHGHLIEANVVNGFIQDPLIDSDGGIFLEAATDNTITGNTVSDAGDAGIFLFAGSHDNLIEGNTVSRSSDSGISISDSDGNDVVDNVSHANGGAGVALSNAHNGSVTGNDARFNPGGIEIAGSNGNLVEDNDVSFSSANGITVEGGLENDILDNVADLTQGTGIAIEAEAVDALGNPIPGNVIEGNSASNNVGDGISVSAGGHVVTANSAHNNGGFGIVAGELVVDGGANTASGNAEPLQCVGVVCTTGTPPPPGDGDLTPPDTVIMSGPLDGGSTLDPQVFTFTGTDDTAPTTALSFECRLDAPPDPPGEPPEPPEPGEPPDPPQPPDSETWHDCASPWTYELLLSGEHVFEVRAIDPSDNVDLTPAVYTWTLVQAPPGPDSIPPTTTIFDAPPDPSTGPTATFSFTGSDNATPGPNLVFQCQLDGLGYAPCTSPVEYTGLGVAEHTFEVQAVDLQGNVDPSPATHTWTIADGPVDGDAPETTIDSHPDATTVATDASFTFSSDEESATFECSIDGSPFTDCTSPQDYPGLSVTTHTFEVQSTDPAGNTDSTPASFTWTVTSAPVPTAVSCGQVVTVSVSLTNNLVDCLGDGLVIGASGITIDLDGHTIDGVTQGLSAGIRNEGFDSVTIIGGTIQEFETGVHLGAGSSLGIIDGVTAQLNVLAGIQLSNADSGGNGNTIRNSTVAGNADGILITNGTQDASVYDNVISGNAGFGLHVLNSSGTTVESNTFSGSSGDSVLLEAASGNTVVGNTVISGGGTGIMLHVGSSGNVVEGNTVTESESGVVVLDSNGNEIVGNVAQFNGGAGIVLDNAHDSVISGNDVRFNSSGIELLGSSNNLIEENDASLGDGAGISLGDSSIANTVVLNTANANGAEGIHVGDFAPGGSGNMIDRNTTTNNTADGIHVGNVGHVIVGNTADNNGGWGIYAATATTAGMNIDGGGNRASGNVGGGLDPVSGQIIQCFNVVCDGGDPAPGDSIPPETTITTAPWSPTSFTDATFEFTGSDNATAVTFECRLDSTDPGDFAPCVSPITYTGLGLGTHTFEVRAKDFSGNVDATPASFTWEIEPLAPGVPPETSIDSSPDPTTVSTTATFVLSSNEPGVTFECSLDDGPYVDCTTPVTYTGLAATSHTFAARAVDTDGLEDLTPATFSWTITAAPTETSVSCGQVLTQSTLVTNDLVDCLGPGLVVGANAITVDLDGHVIDGVGQGIGILNNGFDSVTVTNGTVQEFDVGVQLNPGTTLNIVSDVVAQSNEIAGIQLNDADDNTVRANTATLNGMGIHLASGTQDALVTDNDVTSNSTGGIVLEGANGNTITANSLSGNDDAGIGVGTDVLPANDNQVTANTITTSGGPGIAVIGSSGNEITGNVASQSNGAGISLELANDNVVTGNDVRFNPGGIELSDSSDNLIQSNNAGSASGTGISVEGLSFGNSILSNTASANNGDGISVDGVAPAGSGNLIEGNTASSNSGDGISVTGSGHTITGNVADLNDGWGIFVEAGNVDGGGNSATGNAEPTQCFGIACTSGPVPGAPDTSLVDVPPNPSNSRNALFTFIGTDDTTALIDLGFECRLDSTNDLDWVECDNPQEYFELTPGEHTFEVRAVDLQENVDPTPATYTWEYVPLPAGVAPDTFIDLAPPLETMLFEGIFTFSSDEPDVTFECALDAGAFEPCVFAYEFGFEETEVGEHTFQVRATDFEGNTDPTPATYTWTIVGVVTTVTDGPAFIPPEDPLEPAQGGETSETTATITFEANVADATFDCSIDLLPFAPCTSPVTYTDLAVGEHLFRVIAFDPETERTQLEPTEYGWTVILPTDVTTPDTTITVAPADGSSDTFFEFTGTDDQTQPLALEFECRLDSTLETDWFGCLSPFNLLGEFPEFAPGPHTFEVRAIDQGEPDPNIDPTPAVHTWTSVADATPPETTLLTTPPATTDQIDVEFIFDGSDNATPLELLVFECSVDGLPFEPCDSPESVQGLEPGSHTFEVRTVDLSLNPDPTPALFTWTLVNTPVGTDVTVETLMPSGLPAMVTFPVVTAFGDTTVTTAAPETLPDGFEVANALFVDVSTTATYTGSVEICLGYDPAGFADPANVRMLHYVGGIATDVTVSNDPGGEVCGVVTSLSPFAVAETTEPIGPDTTPPETTIDSGPPADTTATTATFTFSSNEPGATFECALDAGSFGSCTSPHEVTELGSGAHTLQVQATDLAGNVDPTPATYSWTVDGPPTSEITLAPDEITELTTVTFEFEASDPGSTFECWLDGVITPCTSPVTYTDVAVGDHIFAVLATDPVGNIQLEWEDYEFTVLAPTAPTTSFETAGTPPGSTTSTSATFAFTGTDNATATEALSFQCSLDAAPFTDCTTPHEITGLSVDTHTFQVRAVDAIGLFDATPSTFTWVVTDEPAPDVTPPETTITSAPAAITTSPDATFTFTSSESGSTFACSLDGEPFGECASPLVENGLELGAHTFSVQATDAAGNTDPTPATHAWTVEADVTAPDTSITSGPAGDNAALDVVFTFTGTDDTTAALDLEFECSLDGEPFGDCSSPHEIQGLALGAHTFEVRAVDAAGNVDVTPATRTWTTVDVTAPETSIDTGPEDPTEATTASFTFSSDDPAATFECALDGAAFAACTTPHELTGVVVGLHTFEVRAVDAGGTTDATPDVYEWTVVSPDAPDTTITAGPAAITTSTDATFLITSDQPGVTFECRARRRRIHGVRVAARAGGRDRRRPRAAGAGGGRRRQGRRQPGEPHLDGGEHTERNRRRGHYHDAGRRDRRDHLRHGHRRRSDHGGCGDLAAATA